MKFEALYDELRSLSPGEYDSSRYSDLASHLFESRRSSRDLSNRVYACLCAIEIARLSAPELPWDAAGIEAFFILFVDCLDLLGPAGKQVATLPPAISSSVIDLLAQATQIQIAGCIDVLADKSDFVCKLFEAGYRVAHSPVAPSRAKYLVCQFLTQVVEELDYELPSDVICLFLDQFNGPGFELSVGIARNCLELAQHVQQFFSALLDDTMASDRYSQAAMLSEGVIEHFCAMFDPSLSLFVENLSTLDKNARVMAVQVVGCVLNHNGDAITSTAFSSWLKRSNDASVVVRLAWVKQAGAYLARPSQDSRKDEVWLGFNYCLRDHDSRVRGSACKALMLQNSAPHALSEILSPRVRDKSLMVRTAALETAAYFYDSAWSDEKLAWIPSIVLNMIYVGDRQALGLVWTTALCLFGIEAHSLPGEVRNRVLSTLYCLDEKSWMSFSAVYRHHRTVATALAGVLSDEPGRASTCADWLAAQTEDPSLQTALLSLTHEKRELLKTLLDPTSESQVLQHAASVLQDVLPKTVVKRAIGFQRDVVISLIESLASAKWGTVAKRILCLISESAPELLINDVNYLVNAFSSGIDDSVLILATLSDHEEVTSAIEQSAFPQLEGMVHGGDEALAPCAIQLIASVFPERLPAVVDAVLNEVIQFPSPCALATLNRLYSVAPVAVGSNKASFAIPKTLSKLIFSTKGSPTNLKCEALGLLVTRLKGMVQQDLKSSIKLAEPVLNILRKILQSSDESDKLAEQATSSWLEIAKICGKLTTVEDLQLFEPFTNRCMVSKLIKAMRDNEVSLFFSPLLFMQADTEPLVRFGLPTLDKSAHDLALMLAYLVYYLAARRLDLETLVEVLKRYIALVLSPATIESVSHVAARVKQFRDVRDPPAVTSNEPTSNSRYLYAVSELSVLLLEQQRKVKGWPTKSTITKSMALPGRMYQSTSSADMARLVAETSYLSELGSPEQIRYYSQEHRRGSKRGLKKSRPHANTQPQKKSRILETPAR